ncbi:uncharacterized protein LJ264_011432 [Porphyrio hochstetteri]
MHKELPSQGRVQPVCVTMPSASTETQVTLRQPGWDNALSGRLQTCFCPDGDQSSVMELEPGERTALTSPPIPWAVPAPWLCFVSQDRVLGLTITDGAVSILLCPIMGPCRQKKWVKGSSPEHQAKAHPHAAEQPLDALTPSLSAGGVRGTTAQQGSHADQAVIIPSQIEANTCQ